MAATAEAPGSETGTAGLGLLVRPPGADEIGRIFALATARVDA